MNFVKYISLSVRISKIYIFSCHLFIVFLSLCLIGCSDQVRLPTEKELIEFESAGFPSPNVVMNNQGTAPKGRILYRVSYGEALELIMPAILGTSTADESGDVNQETSYICRINDKGAIYLPVVGEIDVSGKTLTEIESAVIQAYYPEYTVSRPNVFARLLEQHEQPPITVIGLVNGPGSFPYPSNVQYNLIQAIGLADGLNLTLDPRYATVYRLNANGKIVKATFYVEKGLELEKAMATIIKPGDIIAVEHTPRTRTNEFLKGIFRINIGSYYRLDDLWDD